MLTECVRTERPRHNRQQAIDRRDDDPSSVLS